MNKEQLDDFLTDLITYCLKRSLKVDDYKNKNEITKEDEEAMKEILKEDKIYHSKISKFFNVDIVNDKENALESIEKQVRKICKKNEN